MNFSRGNKVSISSRPPANDGGQIQPIGPTEFDRLFVLSITELVKREAQVGPVTVKIPQRKISALHQLKYGASN